MKLAYVKSNTYIVFCIENNYKDPKFIVDYHVRLQKYKNISAKCCASNSSEEVFIIKKVKNTVPWTCFISDYNGVEFFGAFYEKKSKKQIKWSLELKK